MAKKRTPKDGLADEPKVIKANIRLDAERLEWIRAQAEQRGGSRDPRGRGVGMSDVVRDAIDAARRRDPGVGPLSRDEQLALRVYRKMSGDHSRALRSLMRVAAHSEGVPHVAVLLEALADTLDESRKRSATR